MKAHRRLILAAALVVLVVIAAGAAIALGGGGGAGRRTTSAAAGNSPFLTAAVMPQGLGGRPMPRFDLFADFAKVAHAHGLTSCANGG